MKLEIDFLTMDLKQTDVAIAMLQAFRSSISASASAAIVQPTVTDNGGSQGTGTPSGALAGESVVSVIQPRTATETTETAVEDKPKRKAKVTVKVAGEEKVVEAVGTTVVLFDTAVPTDTSIDALRAALQRFTAGSGMPAGIELLSEFGCKRISELAEKDDETKLAFLAKCPEAA